MAARGLLTTLLAATLLTIGCGGSSSSPTPVPSPTPAPTPRSSPPAASDPVSLDGGNFNSLVATSGWPCLVEFQLPTCPHCQAMVPIVKRLAVDFSGRALVGTVNVSAEPAIGGTYGVRYVPTFVFFKDGREVSRQVGTTSYEDLAARLAALVGP